MKPLMWKGKFGGYWKFPFPTHPAMRMFEGQTGAIQLFQHISGRLKRMINHMFLTTAIFCEELGPQMFDAKRILGEEWHQNEQQLAG